MKPPRMTIQDREIGAAKPVYLIAEMSANHGGLLENAIRIVHAAADAGFDAIKLQTYRPDTITFDSHDENYWIQEGTWESRRLYELYSEAQTPWEWTPALQEVAASRGIALFSSPFDATAVEFLEALNVPAHKIASFELTDTTLLRCVARTGKPVIISTGMATLAEIHQAVNTLRDNGCTQLAILKCTSSYPAEGADLNLALIPRMLTEFDVPIGYSDHSMGSAAAIAAVALGASIVEKHIQLDSGPDTADSSFSMGADALARFVTDVRAARTMLGNGEYGPVASEGYLRGFRRSVIATRSIDAGAIITSEDVRVLRPAIGAPPADFDRIVGQRASHEIRAGAGVNLDDVHPA